MGCVMALLYLRKPCRRWRPAAAAGRRAWRCASSRPAAQVPPSSTQASGSCVSLRRSCWRTAGATSSSSATVSARHSTMISSPGCQISCAADSSRRRSSAAVEQQAAVAVLGQAGQGVEAVHARRRPIRTARSANRSATATACGTASSRPTGPRRAPRHGASSRPAASRRSSCRPARSSDRLYRISDRMACADTSAVCDTSGPSGRDDGVEQAAGPAVGAEHLGLLGQRLAQPAQQDGRAPRRPTSGLAVADLERRRQVVGDQRRAGPRHRPAAGGSVSLENRPAMKAWKLATASPSERVKVWPVAGST